MSIFKKEKSLGARLQKELLKEAQKDFSKSEKDMYNTLKEGGAGEELFVFGYVEGKSVGMKKMMENTAKAIDDLIKGKK